MPISPRQLKLGRTYTPDAGVAERTASAVAALWALLEAPDISLVHRRYLLGMAIWKYTEAPGVPPHPKYRLPFRTLAAMDVDNDVPVQHEHVWTRKWLIDQLLAKHDDGWKRGDLDAFMAVHGVGCTVTRTEHLLLNACGDAEGWQRYAQAGLQVWDAANARPFTLPSAARRATDADVRQMQTLAQSHGVVSEVILAALEANEKPVTPLIRAFLKAADAENIDLVPKYDDAGNPTTYIRLFDAELDEPTPVAVYVNYNGTLDYHVKPAQVPDFMTLDRVTKRRDNYVRVTLDGPERIETALQLLTETLDIIRRG